MQSAVLMATLGTEAQVVTSAFTLLRRQGEVIEQIDVFMTQAPAILEARHRLEQVQNRLPPMHFHILGEDTGRPLQDVLSEADARTAFVSLYNHLYVHKQTGRRVHFLIAGGRKPLALYAMTAAQLLFDEADRLWHLYSEPDFLQSRRMFPGPREDVRLIPIPLIPWHCMAPAAAVLGPVQDPWQAVAQARRLGLESRIHQARRFIEEKLTPAERRVAALLVKEGIKDRDLAQRLHMSEKTVSNHLNHIYQKAAEFWGLDRVQRAQLVALLSPYYLHRPAIGDFSP